MKRLRKFVLLLGIFIILILVAINPAWGSTGSAALELAAKAADQVGSGMPGWPVPDKPIPQHEPGRPSRAGNYSTQVTQINAAGEEEALPLTGLDALLADGVISDPLQGNYRLVSKDDIAFGVFNSTYSSILLKTYENIDNDLVTRSESVLAPVSLHSLDITAGDLNGDGVDEQIAAWVDVDTSHIMLSIGEMFGSDGRPSSDPAAVASNGNIDLVVRGYDQALWHVQNNGTETVWGLWNNNAGGLLLSGPAIASRGSADFDVFAVGTDNQIHQTSWNGANWLGWTKTMTDTEMTAVPAWMGSPPELDAPAAVASGTDEFDIFRVAPGNTLRWNHFNGSAWGEWQGLGGMLVSGPGAVLLDGHLQVFAVGVDQTLWYRTCGVHPCEQVSDWGAWQRVALDGMGPAVSLTSAPTVELMNGGIRVYGRGSDDALWQVTYDGSWGSWSKGGGELASRPAAAGSDLFALDPSGKMLHSSDEGVNWSDFEEPWLPACCLGTPINTGIRSYVTDLISPVDQINLLDIETGHFLGDGRQQIALAYTWEDPVDAGRTGIGLRLFDINDGFRTLDPIGGLDGIEYVDKNYYVEDYYPKIAVGEFDGDAPQEIALAFATRKGGVRVYTEAGYVGRELAWLKEDEYTFNDEMDMEDGWNNEIRSIKISAGWRACFYNNFSNDEIFNCIGNENTDEEYTNLSDGQWDGLETQISRVEITQAGTFDLKTDLEPVDISDGIYKQNNAHIAVEIINFDPQNHELTRAAADYYEMEPADGDHYPAPERTLEIAAGDFDGEVNDERKLNDEIAILYDIYCEGGLCDDGYYAYFNILDVENMAISRHDNYEEERKWVDDSDENDGIPTADIHLTTGDFDGDGRDEIARTWPTYDVFNGGDWGDFDRSLQVLDWDGGWSTLIDEYVYRWTYHSHQDALAAGDLNLDLKDELVFLNCNYNKEVPEDIDILQIYTISGTDLSDPVELEVTIGDQVPVLATGDFSGESLRVGPPTYRVQRSTGDIIALINEPPKHIDILGGVTYDLNSTDTSTYAAYETQTSQSTNMSIQVQRDYGLSAGLETVVGNPTGTHIRNSIDTTYGAHFENTTTSFSEIVFGTEVKAINDDIVKYTGKDLQIWEYPIYEDNSGVSTDSIIVAFPVPTTSNTGTREFYESGNSTCDFWYAPEHQVNNVWSYAANISQLKDYDEDKGILNVERTYTIGANAVNDACTTWTQTSVTQAASSVNMGVNKLSELQIGGDKITVSASPFGVGVSYDAFLPSVKGTLQSSFSNSALSTHMISGSSETSICTFFNSIDPSGLYNYEVTPYLYWSQGGYLVLDYTTNPKIGLFWDRYDKPDPAFILPWADGHCPGKDLFSKDIVINPPFAGNGETVVITATLHNFSDEPVQDVPVRFCLGDPGAGCVQIGNDQSPDQMVDLPARGRVDVAVSWQASGTGDQRIYALIDPLHQITEMHDETTNPEKNNNVAFGVFSMGDSGYLDPGGSVYFDYQTITFTNTQGIPVSVYLPTGSLTETARFEMTPLLNFDLGFELTAYQAGSSRDEPWTDLTFNPVPAVVSLRYSDGGVSIMAEQDLVLYTYDEDGGEWVDAACGEYLRYPEENEILVPICQTGTFVLSDQQPVMPRLIYLPLTSK